MDGTVVYILRPGGSLPEKQKTALQTDCLMRLFCEEAPMLWSELKAAELSALPKEETIVIIPVASLEHHGPHLPTGVDVALTSAIAVRAATLAKGRAGAVVTPTVWSGLAEMHMSLGGTVTLDLQTFTALIRGICRAVVRQGFRKILLLNGHGGNIGALSAITNEIGSELDIAIATTSYWLLAAERFGEILEDQRNVEHACEGETSMMLALMPDLVAVGRFADAIGPTSRTTQEVAGPAVHRWRAFAARSTHGAIGNPTRASREKGAQLIEAAAQSVAELLANAEFWAMQY